MKIYIGSDHAGYELKEKLKSYLKTSGYEIIDKGAFNLDMSDDYPEIVREVAFSVADKPEIDLGIVLGGSGQGEAISVNKIRGIRAIVYYGKNLNIVRLGREHNNANILSLGARFITFDEAKLAVNTFLETTFSKEERHARRIKKIESI